MSAITPERIEAARIAGLGVVRHTPVIESLSLSERYGGTVVLKAENLQRTGSFKLRGALAKVAELGPTAQSGVVAGSAGNHGQALAYAARVRSVPCEIFVPSGASISKCEAIRSYGAHVHEGGDSVDEAIAAAQARAVELNATFVSPYDDEGVVAGQATLGLELLGDIPAMSQVLVPVGGGGLISGVAVAIKLARPDVKIVGVQVEACAPYATGVTPTGPINTLADGIAVKRPGTITRPLIERYVDELLIVTEDEVADAMMFLMEHAHLYVEGAGSVGVAALLANRVPRRTSGTTCLVLSGGNVDLGVLPNLIRRQETRSGRRLILFARLTDRPGVLAKLLTLVGDFGANVIEVEHVREGVELHVRQTGIQLAIEVRDRAHGQALMSKLDAAGYQAREVHDT